MRQTPRRSRKKVSSVKYKRIGGYDRSNERKIQNSGRDLVIKDTEVNQSLVSKCVYVSFSLQYIEIT